MNLRVYQQKALDASKEFFITNEEPRGIISMCPRSGKTLVSQQIIHALYLQFKDIIDENLFVFFVPTRKLLEQTVYEFNEYYTVFQKYCPRMLAVGSINNISIGEGGMGTIVRSISGSESIIEINKWLTSNKNLYKIIFTTYDSSNKVLESLKKSDITPIAFLYDEAHLLTSSNPKKNIENDIEEIEEKTEEKKYIRAVECECYEIYPLKKIFFTGTPTKVSFGNKKIKDKTVQTDYSMDNISKYGEIVFQYTYKKALEENYAVPFDVYTPNIIDLPKYKKDITKFNEDLGNIEYFNLCYKFLIDIFLDKNIGLEHLLIYVNNSKKAQLLCDIINENLKKESIYDITVYAIYTGKNSEGGIQTDKEHKLNIKSFIKDKKSILINIDMLSIGVTMPIVDGVMFAEEIRSESLIIQRLFRPLTRHNDNPNKRGKILIPSVSINKNINNNITTVQNTFKKLIEMIDKIKSVNTNWCSRNISIGKFKFENDDEPITDNIVEIINKPNKPSISYELISNFFSDNFITKVKQGSNIHLYSLEHFKDLLKELDITNLESYKTNWLATDSNNEIYQRPDKWYNGWNCWGDLFGEENHCYYNTVKQKVHSIVKKFNIQNKKDYLEFYNKAANYDENPELVNLIYYIPQEPSKFFIGKNNLWKGWEDYLGIEITDDNKDKNEGTDSIDSKGKKNIMNFISENSAAKFTEIQNIKLSKTWINDITNNYKTIFNSNNDITNLLDQLLVKYKSSRENASKYSCNIRLFPHNNTINFILIKFINNSSEYLCGFQLMKNNKADVALGAADYEERDFLENNKKKFNKIYTLICNSWKEIE